MKRVCFVTTTRAEYLGDDYVAERMIKIMKETLCK